MKVIDLHSDIITDIAIRRKKGEKRVLERVHIPYLKKGGIAGLICAIWVESEHRKRSYERFWELLNFIIDDVAESSEVEIVNSLEEAKTLMNENKIFIVLGIEGLTFMKQWHGIEKKEKIKNAIEDLSDYKIFHSILAWNEINFIASGTGAKETGLSTGLTNVGAFTVEEMQKNDWIVDVSHLDEKSFWGVKQVSNKPLIASHSNVKALCNHERNLTDKQIIAIAETGGVIGVNSHGSFVHNSEPTLSNFVEHISYIANLAGVDHVALGFDFLDYLAEYNIKGATYFPTINLEGAGQMQKLIEQLKHDGFNQSEINLICFENPMRILFGNTSRMN